LLRYWEATKGHNAIRDTILAYAAEVDPSADREPEGLVASQPRARPADVLTSAAIPGRLAALDIGVTSPAAAGGEDAADAMFQRKVAEHDSQRAELEAQNIVYRPIIWTHFGRPHEAALDAIRHISKLVARRRGGVNANVIERKISAAVSVCIARRAALMSLACWPQRSTTGTAEAAAHAAMDHFHAEDTSMVVDRCSPEDTD